MAALAIVAIMAVSTGGDDDSTPSVAATQEVNENVAPPSNATETPTQATPTPTLKPSQSPTNEAKPKPTPPPAPQEPEYTSDEISDAAFLMQLSSSAPSFTSYPDEQLTSLGRAICGDLGDGFDPYGLAFQLAGELNADEVEAAGFVGAAMGAYCPQHQGKW